MILKEHKDRIRELIDFLNYHTELYDNGKPVISDIAWDKKYFELKDLEKESNLYFNDSPTQSISYKVVNSLEKVEHNHDMLSLEKTKDIKDVINYFKDKMAIAMAKMDGLTCSLRYLNGQLVSAETRGNGKIGENVLHNALVIPTIPLNIPYKEELIVDGEIICTYDDFKSFKNEYKNPRNFAAGSIRLLNSEECSKRKLRFIAWDIIKGFEDENLFTLKLSKLASLGFTIVPISFVIGSSSLYEDAINFIKESAEEKKYPIDGIVFKFDDISYGKSLGKTEHHFKNALAYKFEDEKYETILRDIEWSIGRTGQLCPIAVFDPIDTGEAIITRASLHNISILKTLLGERPYKGQSVTIYRANMIVPQIYNADKTEENIIIENVLSIPEICPICGGETKINISESKTEVLICNNINCDGKLINILEHFCGKKGFDIKGLSKMTLEKIIDWGWVNCREDIFELKNYREEWVKKDGFGAKSVDKILAAIESSRHCNLSNFIAALGIPLIGNSAAKVLESTFVSWQSFIDAIENGFSFWEINNFGNEMHHAIVKYDYSEAKKIADNYLIFNTIIKKEETNNLNGLTFVITGKLKNFKNRDELKNVIENNGGKVVGSISGKISYLINNNVTSESSKNLSAKKLGVTIISEEDFIENFKIKI